MIAQLVEHDLAKVGVASSSLVHRSFFYAQVAELVDAYVSGAYAARCAGSSPVLGTAKPRSPSGSPTQLVAEGRAEASVAPMNAKFYVAFSQCDLIAERDAQVVKLVYTLL